MGDGEKGDFAVSKEMEVFLCQRLLDRNLPISERFRALFSLRNLKGPAPRDALISGLRIAPPEAPATGYMFGKGVYFADMVSKSAQCCYTDKNNPVDLMILSEVALGEIYELKNAKYMDKPPKGKHSTKGLGKTIPHESEYVKWKDDVIVPCDKPVSSKVKASELMYNECIIYDTSQKDAVSFESEVSSQEVKEMAKGLVLCRFIRGMRSYPHFRCSRLRSYFGVRWRS